MLQAGQAVPPGLIEKCVFPEMLPDDEVLAPVDVRGVGDDYDVIDLHTDRLSLKAAAEAFVRASDYFISKTAGEPENERPMEMNAAAYRQMCQWMEGAEHYFYTPPPPPPFVIADSGSRHA